MPLWKPGSLRPIWTNAPQRVLRTLLDPATFFQAFCEYEGRAIRLDGWQVAFLRRRQRFRTMEKSVQIGFSWICAMEALHAALMYEDETSSFVSVNESDAQEKILYAQKLYWGIDEELRRYVPVVKDSTEAFWLGTRERPARLLSLPASAGMRGRATHVYLDEIDHWRPGQDREVFTAAMGRVTRARRRLTVGSSVFGEETQLAELMGREKYPDFLKFSVPWWACEVPEVLEQIEQNRRNMDPVDFAQEYECKRGDSSDSAFPQNLIRRQWNDVAPVDVSRLDPDGTFVAGYDPGGSRHPAVLQVAQRLENRWEHLTQVVIRGEDLADQEARLDSALGTLPGLRLAIDYLGLGMQMSESLRRRWGTRVVPVTFTKQTKSQMTQDLKRILEDDELRILRDRELAHQLNRTRRLAGGNVEQPAIERKSHYDKYWALAMMASLITGQGSVYENRGVRVLDFGAEAREDRELRQSWTWATGPWR